MEKIYQKSSNHHSPNSAYQKKKLLPTIQTLPLPLVNLRCNEHERICPAEHRSAPAPNCSTETETYVDALDVQLKYPQNDKNCRAIFGKTPPCQKDFFF